MPLSFKNYREVFKCLRAKYLRGDHVYNVFKLWQTDACIAGVIDIWSSDLSAAQDVHCRVRPSKTIHSYGNLGVFSNSIMYWISVILVVLLNVVSM